jgi:hypothetical protein
MLLSQLDNILPQGQQVAFIFDQQNEFAPRALAAYQEIKELRDWNNRLGSIQFRSRIGCPPLQGADMLVSLIRDDVSRVKKGVERHRAIERLTKDGNVLVGYFDKDNLPAYVDGIRAGRVDRALGFR